MTEDAKPPHYNVTAALIRQHGKILITRRMADDTFGLMWEFPGGKVEENETIEECLIREIREELNLNIRITGKFYTLYHEYADFFLTLHVFNCKIISGSPENIGCHEWKWVTADRLNEFEFPEADKKILTILMEE